jgi:hypothetical protein
MITLRQAKAHLNMGTTTFDDELIADKLTAAKAWVSDYTGADVDLDSTPQPVLEAVLILTAQLFDNREISTQGLTAQQLPFGFLDLLAPYRAWAF